MTLEGTNTWVLHAPGAPGAVVVDPGPLDAGHRRAVLDAVAARGARVVQVLLTHSHTDHAEGADALAAATGAAVRAARGPDALADGTVIAGGELGDLRVQVLVTPGHTADSVCLLLPPPRAGAPGVGAPAALLTGDTVLGRGSSVVAHPDGALGPYLASLRHLSGLVGRLGGGGDGPGVVLLPGHGPVRPDAAAAVAELLEHRAARLEQVRAAVAAGARTPEQVLDVVQPGLAPPLRRAALATTAAALVLLDEQDGDPAGRR